MTAMSIRQRTKARSPSSSLNRSWSDDRLDGHVTVTIEEPLSFKSYVPPVPRGPVFIPDKQYQRRVLGRPSRKGPPFSIRSKACANICAGFSVVAFLFLVRCMATGGDELFVKQSNDPHNRVVVMD